MKDNQIIFPLALYCPLQLITLSLAWRKHHAGIFSLFGGFPQGLCQPAATVAAGLKPMESLTASKGQIL